MEKGLIIKSTGSYYTVKLENGRVLICTMKGKFRKDGIKNTNPVAVGDIVEIIVNEDDKTGIISNYFERKNYIIRKSTNLSKESHIIASNVDQAFLVVTLINPKVTSLFIDRFLISAEAYRIPVILVFNKIDIYRKKETEQLDKLKIIYDDAGYKVIETSVNQNINITEIKNILTGKITVIAGNSGVGKSSIINAVDDKMNLKTTEISQYHKSGKHTTTFAEMHELSFGGYVIDTPGIKGFGIIDIKKDELYHFFPEIFKYSHKCGYYNCFHIHEPNCAVKNAVEKGDISISRYNNYLAVYFADESKYR